MELLSTPSKHAELTEFPPTPPKSPSPSPSPEAPLPPLLRLPLELRLLIYTHLLPPPGNRTLTIHTTELDTPSILPYDPSRRGSHPKPALRRTTFHTQRNDCTRALVRCTYSLHRNSSFSYSLHPSSASSFPSAIAQTNRLLYTEAMSFLYSSHSFHFPACSTSSVAAFLGDLSPLARGAIRTLRVEKKDALFDGEFDRAEWKSACVALAKLCQLRPLQKLDLIVQGRFPIETSESNIVPRWGTTELPRYGSDDFKRLVDTEPEVYGWIEDLKSLKVNELVVRASVRPTAYCSREGAMARWLAFSVSIEDGFARYLGGHMLTAGLPG
jgi:hypothetical protein